MTVDMYGVPGTLRLLLCATLLAAGGMGMSNAEVTVYPAPQGSPVSADYTLTVDGKDVAVYGVPTRYGKPACFAYFDITGPVTVDVKVNFRKPDAVSVHPRSLGIAARRDGDRVTFRVSRPGSVTLLVNGNYEDRPLHLFVSPPAEAPPRGAIVFRPGTHVLEYDKPITLADGQTLYIAGGAWVEGIVRASGARNIRITGRGVLCQRKARGKDYSGQETAPAGIVLANCRDVGISGIVLTRAINGWCSLTSNCDRVAVRGFHVLAPVVWSTDGFNPCNSRDVTIENCFFRTGDDCIAIKGNTGGNVLTEPHIPPRTQPAIENIAIRGCTFWNEHNEVVAIGCETRARHIRNIQVRDCDVIYHRNSIPDCRLGVFGIIPLHGTEIRGILYEDIRVEHCENQLFCFRFIEGIWGIPGDQTFPGTIADVTIRRVSVGRQKGGRRSEFSGWAADKKIQNVTIEDLRYGEDVVRDAEGMGLKCNEHVAGVRFVAEPAGPGKQEPPERPVRSEGDIAAEKANALLKTGQDAERMGQDAAAKSFYRKLVDEYPDTEPAKEAAERLQKLGG